MQKREAVEVILAGKRASARSGKQFTVDYLRLGAIGPFGSAEIDEILCAVASIEAHVDHVLSSLEP
jgi:hypothetical protein